MANFNPKPQPPRKKGADNERRSAPTANDLAKGNGTAAAKHSEPSGLEPWEPEEDIQAQLGHIPGRHPEDMEEDFGGGGEPGPAEAGASSDGDQLRAENNELRSIIAELRQLLDEATSKGGDSWEEREKEYERLLEEKSEVIRTLHLKIQDLEEHGGGSAAGGPPPPSDQEVQEMVDEIEKERIQLEKQKKQMEEQLKQMQQDEEDMMDQMKNMELQMAKERADLARQRNELQRLMIELRHEIEVAQRDHALKERLGKLQRNLQEMTGRKTGGDTPSETPPKGSPAVSPGREPPGGDKDGGKGGFFGRFMGGNK